MTDVGALSEAYRDLTEIDRGREGIRYSATLPDGTPVIALAAAPEVSARVDSPERFIAAFERATAVHHEGIVPVLAWGSVSDGTLHCAYARVEGQEVTPGTFSPAAIATIGVQLARALAAAHDAGLVHGAIDPARIVMTRDRGVRAQLADFGLFSALSEGGYGAQSTTELLSASGYPSPEVQLGKTPDERSDIYSLGASLYELLTGKPPYGGRTTLYVLASVLSEEAASKGDVARRVVDALMRAIEQAPEDRWPRATAFATALAAALSVAQSATPSGPKGRGCLPAGAATALAFLLVGLVGFYWRG